MLYTELQYQWNQPQQIENDERIIFGGFGRPAWDLEDLGFPGIGY